MGRPRKSNAEKLVPAKVCLTPEWFDAYARKAHANGKPLSELLREVLESGTQKPKGDRVALL